MLQKQLLRKKYFKIRQKKYFEVELKFFQPLWPLLKKIFKKKFIYLSLYYPSNFEVNTLKLLKKLKEQSKFLSLLPVITTKNEMKFCKWKFSDILKVNKYGMLEPISNQKTFVPDAALIPLLAYDNKKFRLGYGKGYYDKYINKHLQLNKDILKIGIAFSFQKNNKLPTTNFDVKMDYILTEKGIK